MKNIENYIKTYKALASFVNDFSLLKENNNLSQKEIAEKSGTTQSAISRIETMNTNPSYKVLQKLSEAAGGELFITPIGQMTITIPFGMQQTIQEIADKEEIDVKSLLLQMIKNEMEIYDEISNKENMYANYQQFVRQMPLNHINEDDEYSIGLNLEISDFALGA